MPTGGTNVINVMVSNFVVTPNKANGTIDFSWGQAVKAGETTPARPTSFILCYKVGVDTPTTPSNPYVDEYNLWAPYSMSFAQVISSNSFQTTFTTSFPATEEMYNYSYWGIYPYWDGDNPEVILPAVGTMVLGRVSNSNADITTGGITDTDKWSHNSPYLVGGDFVQLTSDTVQFDVASVLTKASFKNDWEQLEFEFQLRTNNPDNGVPGNGVYIGFSDSTIGNGSTDSIQWYWKKGTSLYLNFYGTDTASFQKAKDNNLGPYGTHLPTSFEWEVSENFSPSESAILNLDADNYYKVVFQKTNYNKNQALNDGKVTLYYKSDPLSAWVEWVSLTKTAALTNEGSSYIGFGAYTYSSDFNTYLKNVSFKFTGGEAGSNNNPGNGDSDINTGGDSGGNNKYEFDFKDDNLDGTPETVVVTDPEGNILDIIPIIGADPGTIWTFRKQLNKFYLLQNGKIIWTYLLSPVQMLKFTSTGYIGWIDKITRQPIATPESAVIRRSFNALYYILDAVLEEEGYSSHPLFNGTKVFIGQTLAVFEDDSFIIDRAVSDEDLNAANFVCFSGKNYVIAPNRIAKSPILPARIVEIIGSSDYYSYLKEVTIDN